MNTDWRIKTDACLLIFDPHQDKHWVESILSKERGQISHVLLGGDYFDAYDYQRRVPIGQMAAYLLELEERFGKRLTLLLGNHDIPYAEAERWSREGVVPRFLQHNCPGWEHEKSVAVAAHLDAAFWRRCRLFQWVNGFVISHAGVASRLLTDLGSPDAQLASLNEVCALAPDYHYHQRMGILACGQGRGGDCKGGGLTWQDWDSEFTDDLFYPQIVGHTVSREGARQKGRSWCLDGGKTCYGILWRSGELQVKNL